MSSISDNLANVAAPMKTTRPFAWSVRREIWEHRAVWIAPSAAAALVLFGFLVRILKLPALLEKVNHLPPMERAAAIAAPFAISAIAIMITGVVVSFFFCLSALNNERRDRSILFWKSLPVSDATAVLAKAFVPFVVVPLIVFGAVIATQLTMVLIAAVVLTVTGNDASIIWNGWPLAHFELTMLYALVTGVLWYAPIYGWLLMVSSWARRVAFLWAVLPWLGLFILEKIAFSTNYVGAFIDYRLNGAIQEGFSFADHGHHLNIKTMAVIDPLTVITPAHFLQSPGLWLGLVAAAAFIAAAVWFRRMRDPG
jgi:ABC-2 type transport system permease protein